MTDIEILEQTINDLKQLIEDKNIIIAEQLKIISRQNFRIKHLDIDNLWYKQNRIQIGTPSFSELVDGNIAKD